MTDSFARPDVERALLGCILENSALLAQATDLRSEELSLSSHASIFRHMLAMRDAGEGIDPITVCHRLESHGELDRIGGLEYLGMLVDGVVHSNFSTYVKILHDLARRRNFIGGLAQVTARAEDNSVPTKQLVVDLEKLSAGYRGGVMAERNFRFRTAAELAAGTPEEVKWVARPFVAAGAITSVIGKVKSAGKTTFFTYLVKSVLDGAPFIGTTTAKGPVLYLSEQPDATLRVAFQRAKLLHREDLRVMTWAEASELPWPEIMRLAVQECKRIGAVLLVVDTIGQFTGLVGDAENNAGDALRAMKPLQQAAAEGLGILVSQHERKSGGGVEDSGRGSSAFAGAADIILSIRRLPGNTSPNVRTVRALSRFDEPPPELTVALTAEGYVIQDAHAIATAQAEASILAVVPNSEANAMTIDDLCEKTEMKRTTGQDAVKKLVQEERLFLVGKGRRSDPYRYYAQVETHSAGINPV